MKKTLFLCIITSIFSLFCMEENSILPQEKEFFKVVQQNDISGLKRLIFNENININICIDHTALMLAVQNNYNEMAQELLRMAADINLKNNYGQRPLELAINKKNAEMVTTLLNNAYDFNIDQQDKENNTPLVLAVKSEDPHIIQAVLAEVPDFCKRDNNNETALQLAEKISDETVKNSIKKLLICAQPQFNLYKAITLQYKDDIEEYITPDISLNITSIRRNPLITAIKTGNIEIVKLLASRGACVNQILQHKITPLMCAVIQGATPIVDFLLTQSADPNAYAEIYGGVTPIFVAVGTPSNFDIMKLLVENKADINCQISPNIPDRANGITPLMTAVEHYEGSIRIQELLALRADLSLKNSEGQTALDRAKKKVETAISDFSVECRKEVVTVLENAIKGNLNS